MTSLIKIPTYPSPISQLFGEIDTFFNSAFDFPFHDFGLISEFSKAQYPKINYQELDDCYFIEAEIAGLKKEDISITQKDGYLTIAGVKTKEEKKEKTNYIRREIKRSSFSRTIPLPEKNIDLSKLTAIHNAETSCLEIKIPKIQDTPIDELKILIQ